MKPCLDTTESPLVERLTSGETLVNYPSIGLELALGRRGQVSWSNDWCKLIDLALECPGVVKRVYHAGHGDPVAQYEEYFPVLPLRSR